MDCRTHARAWHAVSLVGFMRFLARLIQPATVRDERPGAAEREKAETDKRLTAVQKRINPGS